ncbi:MAG: DUF1957 domain-containing protein [Myxococcales bacterium]|nr:DUF1957 domain-containing protein [Myxococcales bacterium]
MTAPAVAVVLHAHLPWVRDAEVERSLEERWLFEALFGAYLPLVELGEALARRGTAAPALTVSLSPPLVAMLRDELLRARFLRHLDELRALCDRAEAALGSDFGPAVADARLRLLRARATWDRIRGDVPGALARAREAGVLELWTTAASHAFLPGLAPVPGAARVQLALGRAYFEAVLGCPPDGLWLPECGFVPALDAELAALGVRATVLDGHALGRAGEPGSGWRGPVLASPASGRVAYFGRDTAACHEVWSREHGFPGDARYREFFRDVGFELDDAALGPLAAPAGARAMTGLKLWRVTSRASADKLPYEPEVGRALAREHARAFADARARALFDPCAARSGRPPLSVVAFDAELFGHFWLEGPDFLAALFEELPARGLALATPARYAAEHEPPRAMPLASSWGKGGYAHPWIGPATAGAWRHVHRAHRAVAAAVRRHRAADGPVAPLLDAAVRELLLLEASDWLFLIDGGAYAGYAERRFAGHLARVFDLLRELEAGTATAPRTAPDGVFLAELGSATLRAAFG